MRESTQLYATAAALILCGGVLMFIAIAQISKLHALLSLCCLIIGVCVAAEGDHAAANEQADAYKTNPHKSRRF